MTIIGLNILGKNTHGIRKYSSENSALNDIKKEKFINDELNNNYDDTNLFIFKYSKPRYGINLLEFYHHCEMEKKLNKVFIF